MTDIPLLLEGSILTDEHALERAADDFGHVVHQQPLAVIQPHCVADVQAAIRFARERGLFVAARGRGHGTYGQAQARGGIVLDMSHMSSIKELGPDFAWVEGGCKWGDLVDRTVPLGLIPPTLTDYLGLSVGGTLSVGGISGASFRHGFQTDSVLELEVVTGTGDFVRCSASENSDLFDAVRAGLGQCGVIVSARVRLVPVPARLRIAEVLFTDVDSLMRALLTLARAGGVDHLDGIIMSDEAGGHRCILTIVLSAGTPCEMPTDGVLNVAERECPYLEFAYRVQQQVAQLVQMGVWDAPHPWLDLFLPASRAPEFVRAAAGELQSMRDGMMLLYALRPSLSRTPLLALPDEDWVFLVDLLRNTPVESLDGVLARNTELSRMAADLGAGVYPIGAVPSLDWKQLFPRWNQLAAAKQRFDPDGIMTPGQGPSEGGR